MAHEIGHLLLRTSGHLPLGIMRASLTPYEACLRQLSAHPLPALGRTLAAPRVNPTLANRTYYSKATTNLLYDDSRSGTLGAL